MTSDEQFIAEQQRAARALEAAAATARSLGIDCEEVDRLVAAGVEKANGWSLTAASDERVRLMTNARRPLPADTTAEGADVGNPTTGSRIDELVAEAGEILRRRGHAA
jgi:hypothetical protein